MRTKEKNLTTLLGLTQENLALLLKLTRSQWSLYDLGLRSIPLAAIQQLAEFISLVISADPVKLSGLRQAEEKEQHQLALKKLLAENKYQQEKLSRKIDATEKKYHTNLRALHWLQQAVSKENPDPSGEKSLLQIFQDQTTRSLDENGWSQLEQYKIKLKVLQQEEIILQEAIGNN